MLTLKRSLGDCGGEYQSVMMTPPNGSAETSGMNDTVSSEARHRKLLTPMPLAPDVSASPGFSVPPTVRPPGPKTDCGSPYDGVVCPFPGPLGREVGYLASPPMPHPAMVPQTATSSATRSHGLRRESRFRIVFRLTASNATAWSFSRRLKAYPGAGSRIAPRTASSCQAKILCF